MMSTAHMVNESPPISKCSSFVSALDTYFTRDEKDVSVAVRKSPERQVDLPSQRARYRRVIREKCISLRHLTIKFNNGDKPLRVVTSVICHEQCNS